MTADGGSWSITTVPDAQALAAAVADRFVEAAREAVRLRGAFRVALAGGSTPARAYELLAKRATGEIPWAQTHVFWGDERPVPPDHPDSNYRMAFEAMLSRVPVPSHQVHRLRGEAQDLEAAAAEYAETLAYDFGIATMGDPPRFDLVLLGMGAEGHTASLFPDSPVLGSRAWVAAPFVPALGMRRLTFTPAVLNAAMRVVFGVSGPNKAAALAAVLSGAYQPERYPAQVVRPWAGCVEWLIDAPLAKAAAAGD